MLVHNRSIYILIISANLILAAYLLLNQKPEVGLVQAPIALVGEKSIKLLAEGTAEMMPLIDVALDDVASLDETLHNVKLNAKEIAELAPEALVAAEVAAKICRVWGPVGRKDELSDLTVSLEAQGGFPEVFATLIESQPDYLVYVEAYESMREAKRIGTELDVVGIENFVIRRDQGPIVSTGVYSTLERAESLQEKLKTLDFPVAIEILERQQEVYSLRGFVELRSEEYLASISDCPTIAQSR